MNKEMRQMTLTLRDRGQRQSFPDLIRRSFREHGTNIYVAIEAESNCIIHVHYTPNLEIELKKFLIRRGLA